MILSLIVPTILIAADICPIEGNREYFRKGDAQTLFGDLLPEFQAADLCVANLECALTDEATPIAKTGPVFNVASQCIQGIRAAGLDVLALANNHIFDHGAPGLRNTIEVCQRAGISTVGAGENLAEASRILVRTVEGVRVGIMAMAENEFSIAGTNEPGASPLDLIEYVRTARMHRAEFDYLLVLVHGGDEFHVPSPRIKKTCHFLVEMGANAVVVQHPHCLGGCEEYRGGHIVYGQGALLMDEAIYRDDRSFHEGFLVKLQIEAEGKSRMELVPFVQSAPAPGARKMTVAEEAEFRRIMAEKSARVQDDALVEADWLRFCEKLKHEYVSGLLGHNAVLRRLNSKGLLTRAVYKRQSLLGVRNIVCCETHREAIETIFDQGMI